MPASCCCERYSGARWRHCARAPRPRSGSGQSMPRTCRFKARAKRPRAEMNRLDGKVAIVFGAGPNIGGTIAHFLAREGARVAVADIDSAVAEETAKFLAARGYGALALA